MLATALGFALGMGSLDVATANHEISQHIKGSYPNVGYQGIAGLGYGGVRFSSDRCKPQEDNFVADFDAQLEGYLGGKPGQYGGAWPNGIRAVRDVASPCVTSSITSSTDFHWDFMTASEWAAAGHSAGYTGHSHSDIALSSWCAARNVSYPCGYHPTRIHINEPKYAAYTKAYKTQFFLHESAHGMGFRDYCGHDSVSNNGVLCVIGDGYLPLDRNMLRWQIYG
ncbi:hypothetical protein [Nocardioides sp.]|uniref:hypothetical protein n=1 Tax=Nocardioides sp. TaxID=35761 RepID=UPI003567EAD1